MRPSFSYLDKADNKTREREAEREGVCDWRECSFVTKKKKNWSVDRNLVFAGGDSSQDEAEEDAKAITVRRNPYQV